MTNLRPTTEINYVLRTRLELEENFFKTIKLFLIITQIFCAAPANIHNLINPTNTIQIQNCSCANFLNILHYIWCSIIFGGICYATYSQFTEFDQSMPVIQKALYISEYITNILNVFVVIIGCYYQKKYYRIYTQKLIDIDQKLHGFHLTQNVELIKKFLYMFLILYAIYFLIVWIVDFFYSEMKPILSCRSSMVYITPNVIMLFSLTQYWCFIFCIQIRYGKINRILADLSNKRRISNRKFSNDKKLKIISSNFSAEIKKPNRQLPIHTIINNARILYSDLERLTYDITESFGILIFTIFVSSFFIISIQLFALYKNLEDQTVEDWPLFLYTILWIIMHSGKIILVLSANNELLKEKHKAGGLLNEIEFQSPETEVSVNRFLLQLVIQNREQTACGVIELNMMFLGSIVGALTTYIIFLIQFDLSTDTLTATSNGTITPSSAGKNIRNKTIRATT